MRSVGQGCFCLAILLALCCGREAVAQEQPSLSIDWYDANQTIYRQNVCNRYEAWDRGEVGLRNALEGLSLRPILMIDQYFRLKDGAIDPDNPGLLVSLMDELARRAGFTWRESFAAVDSATVELTWTEMLYKGVETFDVFATWWIESIERWNNGVAFPDGWNDSTLILVGKKIEGEESTNVNLLNWVEPFDKGVWILMCCTILWSALVYQAIEHIGDERNGRSLSSWFGDNIYKSSMMFSGEFSYEPISPASRIFSISFTVWALLIGATYTANLASFFVEERQNLRTIDSIEGAVDAGLAICNWEGTFSDTYITSNYPTAIQIKKKSEELMYQGVLDGECVFAVSSITTFNIFERDSSINGECSLEQVGNYITPQDAGFATLADVGKHCTSLIRDVINVHMLEMEEEGVIDALWDTYLAANTDIYCTVETEYDGNEDNLRLTVEQMAGTFCMHFAATLIALVVAVVARRVRKRRRAMKKFRGETDASTASPCPGDEGTGMDLLFATNNVVEQVEELRREMAEMKSMLASLKSEGKVAENPGVIHRLVDTFLWRQRAVASPVDENGPDVTTTSNTS